MKKEKKYIIFLFCFGLKKSWFLKQNETLEHATIFIAGYFKTKLSLKGKVGQATLSLPAILCYYYSITFKVIKGLLNSAEWYICTGTIHNGSILEITF